MPDLITLEDFDYTGTASKSGALGVSTEASNSMNIAIDNKIRDIQARLDSAVIRKDIFLQREIMKEYNTLKKVVAGAQIAFNGIAGGEDAIDARQAREIKIGRNAEGDGLSWYDISTIGNQKDKTFEFVTKADGTGGLRFDGYYFDTTSINENTVSKLTPLTGGLNAAVKDFSLKVKAPEVLYNEAQYDEDGKEVARRTIQQNSYDNMEETADNFGQTIVDNKAIRQANYLDALYGINKSSQGLEPSDFFIGLAIEENVGEDKKYKTEEEYIAAVKKWDETREGDEVHYTVGGTKFISFVAGTADEKSVNNLIKKHSSNYYKLTEGSKAYAANKYGIAIEKDDLFKTKEIKPEKPDKKTGDLIINFGGRKLDNDLVQRTRELLNITSIETNDQGVVTPASRDNVIAYIQGQELNFETNKKGTQDKVSGKVEVTSDMITVTSEEVTQGSDKGKRKAVISIQPKPQRLVENGPIIEFEPIKYDLRKESDIEKLLANQYGFSTDKGKKFKAQYDPVLDYLKALRRGTISEDGTVLRELTPN